ncbi:MAG: DNA starvation/stationary phase protection protein [Bacteroidetes bacterium]|nr:MAG: DNA starvation/stationary phase protection protein [Bacteroidota bacterium]
MNATNRIGLDAVASQELSSILNDLLANYTIFYQNVRGYHWNVKGDKFFELHLKFEELYNDLFLKIDEIAERILTLGFTPDHRSSKYLETALIKETSEVNDGKIAVENILSSFHELILKQRTILTLSADINDEGTNSMMSDYIREQEKLVWMYSAFLNK